MKIYQFAPDFESYKFLTLAEDGSSKRSRSFKGQSLKSDWHPLKATLFHGKTRIEKARLDDFLVSCFDQRVLLVAECLSFEFCDRLISPFGLEILAIESDTSRPFHFVNVLGQVEAIKVGDMSQPDLMSLLRSSNKPFEKEIVQGLDIFRDGLTNQIFVTELGVKRLEDSNLAGSRFEPAGDCP